MMNTDKIFSYSTVPQGPTQPPPTPPLNSATREAAVVVAGTLLISGLGALMYFVYELSGCSPAAGFFAATNESVWEHTKLMYRPTLAWTCAAVPLLQRAPAPAALLTHSAAALVASIPLMWAGFAVAFVGYGLEDVVYDIVLFAITIGVGQYMGAVATRGPADALGLWCAGLAHAALLASMCAFSFAPPGGCDFLFRDSETGEYGMRRCDGGGGGGNATR